MAASTTSAEEVATSSLEDFAESSSREHHHSSSLHEGESVGHKLEKLVEAAATETTSHVRDGDHDPHHHMEEMIANVDEPSTIQHLIEVSNLKNKIETFIR